MPTQHSTEMLLPAGYCTRGSDPELMAVENMNLC